MSLQFPTLAAADRLASATDFRLSQPATGSPWLESSVGAVVCTAGLMPLGTVAERQAMARRLVACLNACQGLELAVIEAAVRDRRRPLRALFDRRHRAPVATPVQANPFLSGLATA